MRIYLAHLTCALACIVAGSLAACQQGGPLTPPTTADSPAALGTAIATPSGIEAALVIYDLAIDPQTLTGTATLSAAREAEAGQNLYLLSLGAFLQPASFQLMGVKNNGTSLAVRWRFTHPFPAPEAPSGIPTSGNRLDLGIAGRVCFLTQVESATGNTYFGDVVVNTTGIANADGYVRPKGLLVTTGPTNTFPYQVLVDERGANGSRLAITNGGGVVGNFGTDGWTRAKLGTGANGWTGYGVLHQGQTTEGTVDIAYDTATTGSIRLQAAILAKYDDPRGGATGTERSSNRLPPATADVTKFAYRMPHGALDIERIVYLGETTGFQAENVSSSTLRFHVSDWDARATDSTNADLSAETDVTKVAIGESGAPVLAVCIPGVLGDASALVTLDPTALVDDDSAYPNGDSGVDSGLPDDPLFYAGSVAKPAIVGQAAGTFVGLVRATDVESTLTTPLTIALKPDLTPVPAATRPEPVVYQAISVTMSQVTTPGWVKTYGGVSNDYAFDTICDASKAVYTVGYFNGQIDFGGGARTSSGSSDGYVVKTSADGTYLWDKTFGGAGTDQARSVAIDPMGNVVVGGFWNGTVNFGNGSRTAVGQNDIIIARYAAGDGTPVSDKVLGSTLNDVVFDLAITGNGTTVIVGGLQAALDFGGGLRTPLSTDGYVCAFDNAGAYVFDHLITGASAQIVNATALDSDGNIIIGGEFQTTVNFGSDPRVASGISDAFLVKYDPAGVYVWDHTWGGTANDTTLDVATDPGSKAVVAT
ncbi:MAG: hypothetical protein ABI743_08595, partial [bacterium]